MTPDPLVQVYGRWIESVIPPEAGDDAEEWQRFTDNAAAQLGDGAVFQPPPPEDIDLESLEAMAFIRGERLGIVVDPAGLTLGLVPLVFEHFGHIADLESIAIVGDVVEFTAWTDAKYAELLRECRGVSPRIRAKRLKLMDFGTVRIGLATEAELLEVSATDSPLRDRTQFMVADTVATRFWEHRSGTVSFGHYTGSWRAITDESEERYQEDFARKHRFAADARSDVPPPPSRPPAPPVVDAVPPTDAEFIANREFARHSG